MTNYLLPEFRHVEETIYAYDNLQLKNIEKFSLIDLYIGNRPKNESFCGIIGLGQKYYSECKDINDIFNSFKSKNITSSNKWMIKYNTLDEGLFIIGANMDEIIPNCNYDNNIIINSLLFTGDYYIWGLPLKKIICGNNITINAKPNRIKLDIDFSLIKGDSTYYEYIEKNFFQKYYLKGICTKSIWNYEDEIQNYYYNIIECKKGKFGSNDIDKFPNLSFNINSEAILNFEGKDLFTETKYKYFFNVILNQDFLDNTHWVFGQIFFKKFPIIIDSDYRSITIYNNYTREVQ